MADCLSVLQQESLLNISNQAHGKNDAWSSGLNSSSSITLIFSSVHVHFVYDNGQHEF